MNKMSRYEVMGPFLRTKKTGDHETNEIMNLKEKRVKGDKETERNQTKT